MNYIKHDFIRTILRAAIRTSSWLLLNILKINFRKLKFDHFLEVVENPFQQAKSRYYAIVITVIIVVAVHLSLYIFSQVKQRFTSVGKKMENPLNCDAKISFI